MKKFKDFEVGGLYLEVQEGDEESPETIEFFIETGNNDISHSINLSKKDTKCLIDYLKKLVGY